MAPRVEITRSGYLLIAFALLAVVVLIGKHYEISAQKLRAAVRSASGAAEVAANRLGIMNSCGEEGAFSAISFDMYICGDASGELLYEHIYQTYPASAGGKERIYTFLDNGDIATANELLQNIVHIERYDPIQISDPPTWEEDPFGERYWRFLYYSLRNTRHLLYAGMETQDSRYFEKLRDTVGDFIDRGMEKPHAWDDYHGVAFRTMTLVNTWWKLREHGQLPGDFSDKLLFAIERHGNFLLDPLHYEGENNHGITEAAALFVLAENFPDMTNAAAWRSVALERINSGLLNIVDEDGVLIENSPYYHFYVLEKYWEIHAYAKEHDITISEDFENTLARMVSHATYVLQPDRDVPLLGASIPRVIERAGEFRHMAQDDPYFDFVLSSGERGARPEDTKVFYPSSGIAVLRSGWGEQRAFVDETHVTFDTGPYRTDHSDLDIMTFDAYADGTRIIREGGLYTYEVDNPLYDYFHGTRAHNTVMVDGMDQARDEGSALGLSQGDTWGWVGAEHDAYPGVRHSRALALIEDGAILVVDALASQSSHRYEQLFHLAQGAVIEQESPELVSGYLDRGDARVPFAIRQLRGSPALTVWHGDETARRGLCADGYEVLRECHELSYETTGASSQYITIILLGESGLTYDVSLENDMVLIDTGNSTYRIGLTFPSEEVLGTGYVELMVEHDGTIASWWQRVVSTVRNFFR